MSLIKNGKGGFTVEVKPRLEIVMSLAEKRETRSLKNLFLPLSSDRQWLGLRRAIGNETHYKIRKNGSICVHLLEEEWEWIGKKRSMVKIRDRLNQSIQGHEFFIGEVLRRRPPPLRAVL
jgi:hypothetical protein